MFFHQLCMRVSFSVSHCQSGSAFSKGFRCPRKGSMLHLKCMYYLCLESIYPRPIRCSEGLPWNAGVLYLENALHSYSKVWRIEE